MSHVICKNAKVIPAPEDPVKWCVELFGHPNNVTPCTDSRWICGQRFDGWAEAAGDLIYACLDGEIQGKNRFSVFADELRHGVVKPEAFKRLKILSEWRKRLHDIELAYDSRFVKKEGVEKSDEKAERARALRSRAYDRLQELCADLARMMLTWKPDRSRYHVRVGAGYWVKSRGAYNFKFISDRHSAKAFSRIAAEEFKDLFAKYNPELIEIGKEY